MKEDKYKINITYQTTNQNFLKTKSATTVRGVCDCFIAYLNPDNKTIEFMFAAIKLMCFEPTSDSF